MCGGEITLTTDMLTTDVPLATDVLSYLFASPGKSCQGPGSFPVSSLSLKCKQQRRNGITVAKIITCMIKNTITNEIYCTTIFDRVY